jgi:threonine/homoserine/homoserine lactone efflux protein
MDELISMLLFAISTSFTPGPNNFMLLNSGLHFGIRRSLPHFFGICCGFPLMVLTVAMGFGIIFLKYAWIKHLLKIIGSVYMIYLAWHILTSQNKVKIKDSAKPFSFLQALLFQWVNPKGWLMAVGALSIFTLTADYFNNALAISTIFLLTLIPCGITWLVFGTFLQNILTEHKHKKWFNTTMAAALLASIALIFVE